jgi:(p)ppGpp synthase/HD superfamily hydrolase
VTIEIVAYDRQGLLHDITQVISNESLNMTDVSVHTRQNIATCLLTLEILGLPQLTRVCARLESLKSVTEVRRRNST